MDEDDGKNSFIPAIDYLENVELPLNTKMSVATLLLLRYEAKALLASCSSRGKVATIRECFFSSQSSSYLELRRERRSDIDNLPETQASSHLEAFLQGQVTNISPPPSQPYTHSLPNEAHPTVMDSMLVTFLLHVESRIASMLGHGYYTIGPCGEECLSSIGYALELQDSAALHYRHLGVTVCRSLRGGQSLADMILDRARAYTVSKHDPVTGGVHCSLGGTLQDYIVTSTLASQCSSAVGRALGYSLTASDINNTDDRKVAFVSVGDGSVHNGHFWSALQLARHAKHKSIKVPVVFGISDNGLSISYDTQGYVETLFNGTDPLLPVFRANGNDVLDVFDQTKLAVDLSRRKQAPVIVLYSNLVRRFGHAATDRQSAYLSEEFIQECIHTRHLEASILQMSESSPELSLENIFDRYRTIQSLVVDGFAQASSEEKVTREDMVHRISAPMVSITKETSMPTCRTVNARNDVKRQVMRKNMNAVLDEALQEHRDVVYLGEDVVHGGYYNVTEGLAAKFPGRVIDFPPDETSLLGVSMGMSQIGLTPIVEIPYAKYLDCGFDMFQEIAIQYWLSNGRQPTGMVIRLQGFDRGLFGGNFHTSNTLYIPPGVDVLCYSNGEDYARGFRNLVLQARAGRVAMSVDCTNLLNRRHLHGKDRGWERTYPSSGIMSFHDIKRYGTNAGSVIVTFGNGVVTALQARKTMAEEGILANESELDVLDCPYLSSVPAGLCNVIQQYDTAIFADICKEGNGILASHVCALQRQGLLPKQWEVVAASRTYNPLGNTCTFLDTSDIIDSFVRLTR